MDDRNRQDARRDAGGGPPNAKPRDRGSRQGDSSADSILPGQEYGAGGQVDDGPGVSPGGKPRNTPPKPRD